MRLADLNPEHFVDWLRHAAPYINAHRARTFVINFPGSTLDSPAIEGLIHDIAVLVSLGVRLVLVPGARPQVEERLRLCALESRYADPEQSLWGSTGTSRPLAAATDVPCGELCRGGLRVTDAAALECVKDAVAGVRTELEARLSTGIASSPLAGLNMRVVSGNVITARPVGVRGGIDHQYTGEVRRVDVQALQRHLANGDIVLTMPLGYSPTGEVFNLSAESVAQAVAVELGADKLIHLSAHTPLKDSSGTPIRELTSVEAQDLLVGEDRDADGDKGNMLSSTARRLLCGAARACDAGVARVHLLDRRQNGALLLELFTRDGVGTLLAPQPFETLRTAQFADIPGILALIRPLEQSGALVHRSQELLEQEIHDFTVAERDGAIVATAALIPWPSESAGEIACLAVDPDYQGAGRAEALLRRLESAARQLGLQRLFVLTTRAEHWFRERGFIPAGPEELPSGRRALYDATRGSKVLVKYDFPWN